MGEGIVETCEGRHTNPDMTSFIFYNISILKSTVLRYVLVQSKTPQRTDWSTIVVPYYGTVVQVVSLLQLENRVLVFYYIQYMY